VLPVSSGSASLASPCLGSIPCQSDASCWLRVRYHTRRPKHALISKRYQLLGAASPYGLQHALCTLHLSCSLVRQISLRTHRSARGATLGNGGWLTLTTSGLAPDQICHAFSWRTNGKRMSGAERPIDPLVRRWLFTAFDPCPATIIFYSSASSSCHFSLGGWMIWSPFHSSCSKPSFNALGDSGHWCLSPYNGDDDLSTCH